jgi:hypothetical protein
VAKFCCVVFVIAAFFAILVWQRRRLINRGRDDDRR